MKFLVLGNGLLGEEYGIHGHKVLGSDSVRFYPGEDSRAVATALDFCEELLHGSQLQSYDAIVNCIGISDTRFCEDRKNWETVKFVNGELPGHLSKYAANHKIKFIHISTGCLYDQPYRPCTEAEPVVAHCNYVVSKWNGELGCNLDRDIIIRPRLLFGERKPDSKRNNLLCKLAKFNTFVDEFNTVTWIKDIVLASEALVTNKQSGVFNVGCPQPATMYEIAQILGLDGKKMTGEELRKSQNLYLVNNVMDMTKVSEFYTPTDLHQALFTCGESLGILE